MGLRAYVYENACKRFFEDISLTAYEAIGSRFIEKGVIYHRGGLEARCEQVIHDSLGQFRFPF